MSITSLNDYRAKRAHARAIHPSIWTPDDAIQTAQDFAAELEHAEIGTAYREQARETSKLFGRSRFRRAKILDGLAVLLLMVLAALMGCVLVLASAPKAHADNGMRALAWEVGPELCGYLDEHPTFAGLVAASRIITSEGYTVEESGEVIGFSITDVCPRHNDLLARFLVVFGPRTVA